VGAGPEPRTASKGSVTLELILGHVKGTVIEVAFTNRGDTPIWFRPSLSIDDVALTQADSGAVEHTCRSAPGIRDVPDDQPRPTTPASDYRLLRHAESERWRMDLDECFDLKHSSDYVMTAHWEDYNDPNPPSTPPGAVLVKGPLDAAPVTFHLD
jgi:hypothetical protein